MPDPDGSLMRRAALAACLTFIVAARAAAQQPVVGPAPSAPEFFSRYDFRLTAAALMTSPSGPRAIADERFSWDTHFGGSVDLVDYVGGRAGILVDFEAVLGSEYRPFDPNQGNYTLEAFASARRGSTEIMGMFHHVSRHLSDRPKRFAIAWNELGGRVLHRVALGATTVDVDLEGGRAVQHSFVDYTWFGELNLLVRHALSDHVGVFGHGSGRLFMVDEAVAHRGAQTGGLIEAGVRLNGRAGAIELFAGYEKRVDADPVDRLPQRWGLAGFRLLSR
jgi:hypothetical protein